MEDQLDVHPQRPVVDVAEVHLDPLIEAGDGVDILNDKSDDKKFKYKRRWL